jgi:hypothetical protein
MTKEEVIKLYNTNFKNLLQIDVNSKEILDQKSTQIDNITKKLLAIRLSQQTSSKEKEEG